MALSDNPFSVPKGILSRDGTLTVARQVEHENTDNTGILANSPNVEDALQRLDNTGLGAAPRTFTGSFFCSYGELGNQDQWYGGRQTVTMIGQAVSRMHAARLNCPTLTN